MTTIVEAYRQLDARAAVLEAFVAQWADPILAQEIGPRLLPEEAKVLADVLASMGEPEIAEQWKHS